MYVEGWVIALIVFGMWCDHRDTTKRLRAIEDALRPPDPAIAAETQRKARAWEVQCKTERARKDELSASADYDAYLAPIRAQIAAQNSRP